MKATKEETICALYNHQDLPPYKLIIAPGMNELFEGSEFAKYKHAGLGGYRIPQSYFDEDPDLMDLFKQYFKVIGGGMS